MKTNKKRLQKSLKDILLACCWLAGNVFVDANETSHSFLACGEKTYIVDGGGKKIWTYPHATRDGYVLADGSLLLTLSRSKQHPGGAVIKVTAEGKESVVWNGTQSEVNSAQPTNVNTVVITEAGPKPRLLELDYEGKVTAEFPLQCQNSNHHMQTRMARKLPDGTYLVPHLLDFGVFTYNQNGNVLGKLDTTVPEDKQHSIHSWPFTAIRHGDGRTLVCCTNGNRVFDFDKQGKVDWELTNKDLPGPWLQDPCGGQVLPNGNVVITSYAAGRKDPQAPKLIEVNREKQVVWTFADGQKVGIHNFQILDTDGVKLTGPIQK
ncbi:MAG: hypothetical protein NTW52_08025 [Planctomycetota bacterium]|nr:hypothetical protein [Planctomycetota bacterium]